MNEIHILTKLLVFVVDVLNYIPSESQINTRMTCQEKGESFTISACTYNQTSRVIMSSLSKSLPLNGKQSANMDGTQCHKDRTPVRFVYLKKKILMHWIYPPKKAILI